MQLAFYNKDNPDTQGHLQGRETCVGSTAPQELLYAAAVHGWVATGQAGWCLCAANTGLSADVGQGRQRVAGRCHRPHARGGRYCTLFPDDNLAANLPLLGLSRFTTFQTAEETKPHTILPPSGAFQPASTRDFGVRSTGSHKDQYSTFFVAVLKAKRE